MTHHYAKLAIKLDKITAKLDTLVDNIADIADELREEEKGEDDE